VTQAPPTPQNPETSERKPKVISGLGDADTAQEPDKGHSLNVLKLDDRTYDRALSCVHCGLCLPACPTYTQNGLEADSPRGRIYLMKSLADGTVEATDSVVKHLDLCLDCQACETACPSGVVYHELIEETRDVMAKTRKYTLTDKLIRAIFFHVFTQPSRLKLALLPTRIMQRIGLWGLLNRSGLMNMLPKQFQKMNQMLPPEGPLWETNLAASYPATANRNADGTPRATIAMFTGCVGSVMFQPVNRRTVALLNHFGCDVIVPQAQVCCGAIHHHGGETEKARQFARKNIDVILPTNGQHPDFIVNNIAGCGAAMKDVDHLLRDDAAYAERAKVFAEKSRDISELLVELDPPEPTYEVNRTVTYHHACHLAHAQKAGEPPLTLLSKVKGLKLVPLVEADMCCGAAGTYNLSQPEMARDLAERKIGHIERTGANVCVTANVGCAMQIKSEADRLSVGLTTAHPVDVLYEAYIGPVE